jgi:hypothetical protein
MRQVPPLPVPPLERLAKRICKAANARDNSDAATVIASFKQRAKIAIVDAAVEMAVAKQWLRFDGVTYTLTPTGADMDRRSRAGPRTKRVSPF